MDLIPRQKPNIGGNNLVNAGNFIKSRGISIYGKEFDMSFLKGKWVVVSLAGVILALLSFGAIRGYIFYVNKKTDDLALRVDALASGQDAELLANAGSIEALDGIVNKLRKDHIYSSNFLILLEKLTLSEIQWQSLTLDVLTGAADLRGRAASYSYLAKQIIDFEKEKIKITVSGVNLDKGGVGFSAKLKFDAGLLKK